jgi:uncharacterized protein (DUF1330 family)
MVAYVISEVRIVDESLARRYRSLAEESIVRHGGRYVVRGAEPRVPEGQWERDRRVVMVEFPTMEMLNEWYASDDYAEALRLRDKALDRRLLFVDGL